MAYLRKVRLTAIASFAELEAILLDPVYSAQGAAGFIDLIRQGIFSKNERVVFLHSGGAVTLFGYRAAFDFCACQTDAPAS